MKKYLSIIIGCLTSFLLFPQESKIIEVNDEIIAGDSNSGMKFPTASIHHTELSKFIFDKLIPAIRKEDSYCGEIRLKIFFSRISESTPISVDLKLTINNELRDLSFVDKASRGLAYVSKGDILLLIHDEDSIAVKEGFIVRSAVDSLEVDKKYWSKIGFDDSEFFCYYFSFTIDRDSIFLDTFKNYGAGYVVNYLNESAIDSIMPKKSKLALERERRKKNRMSEPRAIIKPIIFKK